MPNPPSLGTRADARRWNGAKASAPRGQGRSPLPGFGIALGFTLLYLSLLILVPIAAVFAKSAGLSWEAIWKIASAPRTLAAFKLSLWASGAAALINAVFGLVVAWVLERYEFPDGGWSTPWSICRSRCRPPSPASLSPPSTPERLARPPVARAGHRGAYTPIGVVLALTFIGCRSSCARAAGAARLRTALEEAAASLGATRRRPPAGDPPELLPAVISGCVLAFARALGEYGSVIFIAGNMPLKSEITPLLIMIKLEQFDYAGATTIASMFLLLSFGILFSANVLAWRRGRRWAAPRWHRWRRTSAPARRSPNTPRRAPGDSAWRSSF
jgi:sulfate transport system permease protein